MSYTMTVAERARIDQENAELRRRLEAAEKRLTREVPPEERDQIIATKARFDGVMAAFGKEAPDPTPGMSALEYRRRRAAEAAEVTPMKGSQFYGLESPALAKVEDAVYADAQRALTHTARERPGVLVAQKSRDAGGREITKFVGDPLAWMWAFMHRGASGSFNRNPPKG